MVFLKIWKINYNYYTCKSNSIIYQLKFNVFFLKFIKDDHFETVVVEVANYDELLKVSSEILSCTFDKILAFLFTDGTLIDENNYLQSLPIRTKLLICTLDERDQILSFFQVKRLVDTYHYDLYWNLQSCWKIIFKKWIFK